MWNATKHQVGRVLSHRVTVSVTTAMFLAAAADGVTSAVAEKPYWGGEMLGVIGLGQNYNHVAGLTDRTTSFVLSAFER